MRQGNLVWVLVVAFLIAQVQVSEEAPLLETIKTLIRSRRGFEQEKMSTDGKGTDQKHEHLKAMCCNSKPMKK